MQKTDESILLVDDDELVRQATCGVLQTLGYHVYESDSGEGALQLFQKHHNEIAILISDIFMPTMDGVTLANYLRNLNPHLPVILATGHDRDAYLANIAEKERIQLLIKPYHMEELDALIHRMLDG